MMCDILNSTCDISYVDAFILYYDTSYDYNDVDDCIRRSIILRNHVIYVRCIFIL